MRGTLCLSSGENSLHTDGNSENLVPQIISHKRQPKIAKTLMLQHSLPGVTRSPDVKISFSVKYYTVFSVMCYNIVQCHVLQYCSVSCVTILFGVVCYNIVQCRVLQYCSVSCVTILFSVVCYNTIQCHVLQNCSVSCVTILLSVICYNTITAVFSLCQSLQQCSACVRPDSSVQPVSVLTAVFSLCPS